MNEILPTYTERQNAARDRLRIALNPQTARERFMLDWLLGCLIADETDEWSVMVERAYVRGIDIGKRAAQITRVNGTELGGAA